MSLNKQQLTNDLVQIFDLSNRTHEQQESVTVQSSASVIAAAITNFMNGARALLVIPGIQLGTPPVPDVISPPGIELKPLLSLLEIGNTMLTGLLVTSMVNAQAPDAPLGWPEFVAGFPVYLLSLTVWAGGGYTGPTVVIPGIPINILNVHIHGKNANSANESAILLADAIHTSVITATISGIYTKLSFVTPPVAGLTIG